MLGFSLRKAWYAFVLVQGIVAVVAPRLSLAIVTRLSLPGFENAGTLQPKPWYVRAVRATGVGMIAAGGTGLLLEGRAEALAANEPDEGTG